MTKTATKQQGQEKESSRILYVEDDTTLAHMVKDYLEERGEYQVVLSSSVNEALQKLTEESYELVLLDNKLGQEYGIQVLASLRRSGSEIPVVTLSKVADIDQKVLFLDMGADDYVTKPFSFGELTARINSQIKKSRRQDERSIIGKKHQKSIRFGSYVLKPETTSLMKNGEHIPSSPKEYKILEILALNLGEVCLRENIWKYVHGSAEVNTNTLDVHIMRVRKKVKPEYEIVCLKKRGFILRSSKHES